MKKLPLEPEKFQAMIANLEKLQELFPKAFPRKNEGPVQPLKQQIHKDILAKSRELELGMGQEEVRHVLGYWVSRPFYLRAFKKATSRIDLDGNVVNNVTDEHKAFAKELKHKLWKRAIPANSSALVPEPDAAEEAVAQV